MSKVIWVILIDLAELRSPSLPASSAECQIIFYYWLVGNSTGTLELFASGTGSALWKNRVHQLIVGFVLLLMSELVQLDGDYFLNLNQIRLFGVWTDDVAIDDISFSQCSANRSRHVLDCDFETDFCSWETNGLADFEWTRTSSKTTSLRTGPLGDHTTGSGYYIYIEASLPQKPGDRAWLVSPLIPATTASCLVFYYHM